MNIIFERLWPEIRPFKWKLLFVMLLGIAISGLKSTLPKLMQVLSDDGWKDGNEQIALYVPVAIAVMWLFISIFRYFHLFWMKYIGDVVAVSLRRKLMDKYLRLNLSFFQQVERGSGGLISRMLNDIQQVQEGIGKLADLVREPFLFAFSAAYLIYLDWKLFLFLSLSMPVIAKITKSLTKSLRKYGHKNQESVEDLTKTLKEGLDGARIVQSFNLQKFMHDRFNEQADEYLTTRKKIISREETAGPVTETIFVMTLSAILVYIGGEISKDQMTVGHVLSFITATGLISDSGRKVQQGFVKVQQAIVALERLTFIMDNPSEVPQAQNPVPFPKDWKQIEFKNLSFSFDGKEKVLKNINLTVRRGETVALVGMSGSGKSTLVNLLQRFYEPSEGDILIDDISVKDIDLYDLRKNLSLVSQDVFLFADSIEKNIQAGRLEDPQISVEKAASLAHATKFIENTPEGYKTRLGDLGNRLSGGEKQRISIARAFYKDSPILILDEATSALDSESEKEVQAGLNQLMQGRTAFVIAHRLSTIVNADRILVMQKGEIKEQGDHKNLLEKNGLYTSLYELQRSM